MQARTVARICSRSSNRSTFESIQRPKRAEVRRLDDIPCVLIVPADTPGDGVKTPAICANHRLECPLVPLSQGRDEGRLVDDWSALRVDCAAHHVLALHHFAVCLRAITPLNCSTANSEQLSTVTSVHTSAKNAMPAGSMNVTFLRSSVSGGVTRLPRQASHSSSTHRPATCPSSLSTVPPPVRASWPCVIFSIYRLC